MPSQRRILAILELGRHDDGGSGHRYQGAKQQRQGPVQPHHVVRDRGQAQPGHHHADAGQVADDAGGAADLLPAQGQAALEQDQGDPQRHHRKQQFPQQGVGVQPAGHGSNRDPGQQQEENGGKLQPPRQPLEAGAARQQAGQHQG